MKLTQLCVVSSSDARNAATSEQEVTEGDAADRARRVTETAGTGGREGERMETHLAASSLSSAAQLDAGGGLSSHPPSSHFLLLASPETGKLGRLGVLLILFISHL